MKKRSSSDTAAPIGDLDSLILLARESADRAIKVIGSLARDLSAMDEGSDEYKQRMAKLEAFADACATFSAIEHVLLERRPKIRKSKAKR